MGAACPRPQAFTEGPRPCPWVRGPGVVPITGNSLGGPQSGGGSANCPEDCAAGRGRRLPCDPVSPALEEVRCWCRGLQKAARNGPAWDSGSRTARHTRTPEGERARWPPRVQPLPPVTAGRGWQLGRPQCVAAQASPLQPGGRDACHLCSGSTLELLRARPSSP